MYEVLYCIISHTLTMSESCRLGGIYCPSSLSFVKGENFIIRYTLSPANVKCKFSCTLPARLTFLVSVTYHVMKHCHST